VSMQYQKVKSVAKQVQTRGSALDRTILQTMRTISEIVGSTLGPGGRQVLIERQEYNLAPMVTKDGVTVFRSLGFDEPAAQCIMEAARDASVRTASEAGDGTTTATILAESIVRLTKEFTEKNPRVSPQRVVRRLEAVFKGTIEPLIKDLSTKADLMDPQGRELLKNVAKISANGDTELADAVMQCFDLVGDDGNVTISEVNGASKYEVERIEGYPIGMGYEESCAKFYPKFINDPGNQRVLLERPRFVIYHGRIQDPQSLFVLLNKLGYEFESQKISPNVVLVATGFSENVLGYLSMAFAAAGALNVFPLLAPQSPFPNGQLDFLLDLAAMTGATLLDPMNLPFEQAELEHFGTANLFESYRFRSNVVGKANEDLLLLRVDELQTNLARAESQLDTIYLQERIGKLTGGIARLKVIGASNGELKEKRDRAEDAVCAVRGAIKHGCLPGGAWTLLRVMAELRKLNDPILEGVLIPALFEPFRRLLENVGITEHNTEEFQAILKPILERLFEAKGIRQVEYDETGSEISSSYVRTGPVVYDALEGKHVDPFEGGVLDSTPAVLEAVRNSLSIASLLGTLGGTVVFKRDSAVEQQEARDMANFMRDANRNEADERG
jgi:chaperonin GroEL